VPRHARSNAEKLHLGITRPSRLNPDEPQPRAVPPRMPPDVRGDPAARAVWRAVLRESPPAMITALDALALAWLATSVVERDRALAVYRRAAVPGLIRARGDGRAAEAVVVHPSMRVVRFWANEVRVTSDALGLSPRARAALHVPGAGGLADTIESTIGPTARLRILSQRGEDAS
jgi:hypothetical protein